MNDKVKKDKLTNIDNMKKFNNIIYYRENEYNKTIVTFFRSYKSYKRIY